MYTLINETMKYKRMMNGISTAYLYGLITIVSVFIFTNDVHGQKLTAITTPKTITNALNSSTNIVSKVIGPDVTYPITKATTQQSASIKLSVLNSSTIETEISSAEKTEKNHGTTVRDVSYNTRTDDNLDDFKKSTINSLSTIRSDTIGSPINPSISEFNSSTVVVSNETSNSLPNNSINPNENSTDVKEEDQFLPEKLFWFLVGLTAFLCIAFAIAAFAVCIVLCYEKPPPQKASAIFGSSSQRASFIKDRGAEQIAQKMTLMGASRYQQDVDD